MAVIQQEEYLEQLLEVPINRNTAATFVGLYSLAVDNSNIKYPTFIMHITKHKKEKQHIAGNSFTLFPAINYKANTARNHASSFTSIPNAIASFNLLPAASPAITNDVFLETLPDTFPPLASTSSLISFLEILLKLPVMTTVLSTNSAMERTGGLA